MRTIERAIGAAVSLAAVSAAACAGTSGAVGTASAPALQPAPVAAVPAPVAPAADSAALAARRVAKESSEARALAGLATTEAEARHLPEALVLADSAAALGDTDLYLVSLRGRLLASAGRCHGAVAILLPLVRAHPEVRSPTPELAYCLLRLDRAPEAVAVMQVAVQEEPRAPPLQWALMEAFIRTQQLDSALAHAVYLKETYPQNGLWWVETGRVLVLLNRMDEARLVFERGFQLRPGLIDSLARMDRSAWEAAQALGPRPQR